MRTPQPSRRSVLAGTAAAAALTNLPALATPAHAAASTYERGRRRRVLRRLRGTPAPATVADQAVAEPPHGGG